MPLVPKNANDCRYATFNRHEIRGNSILEPFWYLNRTSSPGGKLDAFTNKMNAAEKSGKLTIDQSDELVESANSIQESVGC
jgi:hypothetical protein